jgi:membrane-associated phospholipid phosphatase
MVRSQAASAVRTRRPELPLILGAMVVLVISALPVQDENVPRWELSIERWVNDWPDGLYRSAWVVMQLGNAVTVPLVALIAAAARRLRLAAGLLLAGVSTYLLAKVVKVIVTRKRPAALVDGIELRGAHDHGIGYPSGHSAVVFCLATVAFLWFRDTRWRWIFPALAALTAVFRVYVGAHFPLDVVGGGALGIAAGALVAWLLGFSREPPAPDPD